MEGTAHGLSQKIAVNALADRRIEQEKFVIPISKVSSRAKGSNTLRSGFREIRASRIYDGPTEVHKWSLAKKIKREWREANG